MINAGLAMTITDEIKSLKAETLAPLLGTKDQKEVNYFRQIFADWVQDRLDANWNYSSWRAAFTHYMAIH